MVAWINPSNVGDAELIAEVWGATSAPTGGPLTAYLTAAQTQCEAFAPALPDSTTTANVPANYKIAVLLQARALRRASTVNEDNGVGPDGLTVTVFPMDWSVKRLLRPERMGFLL